MPCRLFCFFLMFVLCCFVSACGSRNAVQLEYTPSGQTLMPNPTSPSVTVVAFEDKRTKQVLGERYDGSPFVTASSVSDWAGRAFAAELARLGDQVSYTDNASKAMAANPRFLATGTIHEIWIQEENRASVTATVSIFVQLAAEGGIIYSEELKGTQNRKSIPTASMAESLLEDTLRDLLVSAAQKMTEKMH